MSSINNSIADIIQTNFITGYRAYDVCHNKSDVVKIRAINDVAFDINSTNMDKIYYNEETINGQKIPYIYGNIDSFINFPNIITSPNYSICAITRYNGDNTNNKNKILTIQNINNKISSIGHNNRWAGIVEYTNSSLSVYKSSLKNYNNNWVVTCMSYNSSSANLAAGEVYIGSKDDPNGAIYTKFNDIEAVIGKLGINSISNPTTKSEWGLSHLLVWNKALTAEKLKIIYSSFISYLSNPAKDDIVLYKNNYPRDLLNCIEPFYINPSTLTTNVINLIKPLWAGYYAGDYDSSTNTLPELLGNTSRDLTSNMLKNITLNNVSATPYIGGNKESYVIFPENSINSDFTICAITKYTSTIESNNNMILQSINNSDANLFYHGHYKNKNGVITYNNYEFSKNYISTQPVNSWIVSCAKNTNSTNLTENVLINGNNSGLYIESEYINKTKNLSTLTINYNNDRNVSFNSEWALNFLLIWNSHLSDMELKNISVALNNYIQTGQKPVFVNPVSNQISNNSITPSLIQSKPTPTQYMGLNLTDLQKQMLL
jgi:hypothetical protein